MEFASDFLVELLECWQSTKLNRTYYLTPAGDRLTATEKIHSLELLARSPEHFLAFRSVPRKR